MYAFPPFALLKQILSRVMIVVAPLWPQKEWFIDPSLLMDIPLELWNLLVQPHIQKFHRGLESLYVHAWKLSSNF